MSRNRSDPGLGWLLRQIVISALLMAFPFVVVLLAIKFIEYFGTLLWWNLN